MQFDLHQSIEILERTPTVLKSLLSGLSDEWVMQNEGGESWSPYDVVGHLLHGEKTDWMARMNIILQYGESVPFERFDRFAQFTDSKGKTLDQLLEEFTRLRHDNLRSLKNTALDGDALDRKGTHPVLGTVTLRQLLATWTTHDLAHIVQISRVMAKLYKEEIGPWTAFFSVVNT